MRRDGGLKLRRRGRAEGISVRITQGICGDGPLLRDVVERKETITNSAVYNLLFALPTLPGLLYSHGGGRKPGKALLAAHPRALRQGLREKQGVGEV